MPQEKTKIAGWQNSRIEGLLAKHHIDRESYYAFMREKFHVESKKDLTLAQANVLIRHLHGNTERPGKTSKRPARRQFATMGALGTLRYHALACAVAFAEMKAFSFGYEVLQGEELRSELVSRFNLGRMQDPPPPESKRIPATVVRYLYESWINPKSNALLIEGGFRAVVRDDTKLFYEKLSPVAVQHLIDRYRAMHRGAEQTLQS